MPDDTTLPVRFRRNDFDNSDEEFVMKANSIDRSLNNNMVIRSILSAAGDIAGKDVALGTENYTISGLIHNTDPDTYPSYESIDTNEWSYATEKEMNLAQAVRVWGPDADNGFDTLIWGPRERSGMFSSLSTSEDRNQRAPNQYQFSVQWSHTNVYIGD